jgi:hypothetical protein
LVLTACATETTPAPEPGFHGNTFTEPSRGIHATLPTGWVFVPPEKFSSIREAGTERDPELASKAAAAATRTQILFAMINASGTEANPESIALLSDMISASYLGMTTETYALVLRNNLEREGYSVYREELKPIKISGSHFQSIHTILPLGSSSQYQSYYIRLAGNEVLTFIATHSRPDRGDALLEIIRSFDLQ